MKHSIYECRLMKLAEGDVVCNIEDGQFELAFEEFQSELDSVLFGVTGYFAIDRMLNDLLFVLESKAKNKKKCLYTRILSPRGN